MTRHFRLPALYALAALGLILDPHAVRADSFDLRDAAPAGAFFGGLQLGGFGEATMYGAGERLSTPLRGPAFTLRAEMPFMRYLLAGLDLMLSPKAGVRVDRVDDRDGDIRDIEAPRLDYGIHLKPRFPVARRFELYGVISGGLSFVRWEDMEIPVRAGPDLSRARAEGNGSGYYVGAGFGVTSWLNSRLGMFLEFNLTWREVHGRFATGSIYLDGIYRDADVLILIEQWSGALVVGVGTSLGEP